MRLSQQPTLKALLLFSFALLLSSNAIAAPKFATKALLNTQMAAERNARVAADNGLITGLSTETNARIAADTAEVAARTSAIQTAVTPLQGQINNIPVPKIYVIGDIGPGQGIVFSVSVDGLHGLEAAPSDQSGGIQWYNGNFTATNAVRDGINAGHFNTERIIINQGAGSYAARLCANYQGGGYGDWYLPSKAELHLLFQQRVVVGGFDFSVYWSSTEFDSGTAWSQSFVADVPAGTSKASPTLKVRAVRAF
jgi:hypothetical protein